MCNALRLLALVGVCLCTFSISISSQSAIPIPGKIEVENYSSSSDTTPGNQGGACRSDDVDLTPTWDAPDPPTGCILGWAKAGEWLGFTISVAQTQTYVLSARVAHPGVGGTFHIEVDNVDVTGPIQIPNTGGWGQLETIWKHGVMVTAGVHDLKLRLDTESPVTGGVANFNYLTLAVSAPFTTAPTLPARFEAEDFDRNPSGGSGEAIAYHDTTSANIGAVYRLDEAVDISPVGGDGGGFNIGWTERAEWLAYTVNVPTAGWFRFEARIAHPGQGGIFHVEIDGSDVTGSLFVPDTESWTTWQTISSRRVFISAGTHVVYVVVDLVSEVTFALANVNWFAFTSTTAPPTMSCGDPNDLLPDDDALQACLANFDEVLLQPPSQPNRGYIVNGRQKCVQINPPPAPPTCEPHGLGLQVTRPGQVIRSTSPSTANRAVIFAGRDLAGFILEGQNGAFAIEYVQFHGAVDVIVNPGPPPEYWRRDREECGLTDPITGDALRPLLSPGNLNISSAVGGTVVLIHNEIRDALCGSGVQIQGNIFVWDNYISHNGNDASSGRAGNPWSDGITALWCRGHIIENTFVDNTDIQVALGGGPCLVVRNTIASFGKFGFAGLNPGKFDNNFGPAGDHTGAKLYDNNIYTGDGIIDKLFIGLLVGSHPWSSEINVSNTGSVYQNTSVRNVQNILVEGVSGGRVGFDEVGASKPNTASDNARGAAIFQGCDKTVNYGVNPNHAVNTLLQTGHVFMKFDTPPGGCSDQP